MDFKRFMTVFDEDYNLLEDGPSRWESYEPYEPSEDEGELESDKPPEPEVDEVEEAVEEMEQALDEKLAQEGSAPIDQSPGHIQDLE